ncbi:hypothetical protein GUJ93_ZPchr0013g35514 [Zizania palustris]|uniref:Uncharacterized protein n=1 Tax=Zizania palustris TaxID=103762 RepID=A0A8J5WYJ0_ZIZPA|nr:hypothetical protein GUJ93_ZPchr0013g35514 [Zizania palustris]
MCSIHRREQCAQNHQLEHFYFKHQLTSQKKKHEQRRKNWPYLRLGFDSSGGLRGKGGGPAAGARRGPAGGGGPATGAEDRRRGEARRGGVPTAGARRGPARRGGGPATGARRGPAVGAEDPRWRWRPGGWGEARWGGGPTAGVRRGEALRDGAEDRRRWRDVDRRRGRGEARRGGGQAPGAISGEARSVV